MRDTRRSRSSTRSASSLLCVGWRGGWAVGERREGWRRLEKRRVKEGGERSGVADEYTHAADTQHPAMKRAVSDLKARGDTTFLCLSNSNEVYIGTILEVSKGLGGDEATRADESTGESDKLAGTRRLVYAGISSPRGQLRWAQASTRRFCSTRQ